MHDVRKHLEHQRIMVHSLDERKAVRAVLQELCPGVPGLYEHLDWNWSEFPHIGVTENCGTFCFAAWRSPSDEPSMSVAEFIAMYSPEDTDDEIDLSLIL